MFFFEKYDSMLENIIKILTLPIRIFGYCNSKQMVLEVLDKYDNYYQAIEKIDLYIKNSSLNIKSAKIVFVPLIGYIKWLVYYFKYIFLPFMFVLIIFLQTLVVLLLIYFFRKPSERTN